MRLTSQQQQAIREEAIRAFGEDVCVRLFGSRVDDQKRGGDIDLYIEGRGTARKLLDRQLKLHARLLRRLGDRHIDIVVRGLDEPDASLRPVDIQARRTGVTL